MQRQVANPLAEQVLSGDVEAGARVEIDVAPGGGALAFSVAGTAEEETPDEEAEAVAA